MADLLLSLIAKDEMSSVFGAASGVVLRFKDALVDMTKAAMESERVGAQLRVVAGDLTSAFQAQANAVSAMRAVDDEAVQSMQTMLLRYGEAPGKVRETTLAILDYAAATGQDAASATDALVRGVEKGHGSIKALGITYKETGEFTKDLEAATKALGARYAGAGEAEANTLAGQLKIAQTAFDNIKESFGNFVLLLESKVGAVNKLTQAMRGLNQAISQGSLADFAVGVSKKFGGVLQAFNPVAGLMGVAGVAAGGDAETDYDAQLAYQDAVEGNQADAIAKAGGAGKQHAVGKGGGSGSGLGSDFEKALRDNEANVEASRKYEENEARVRLRRIAEEEKAGEAITKARERELQNRERLEDAAAKRASAILDLQAKSFEDAGIRMGGQLVAGIIGQLKRLDKGGEFDVAAFFGSIFQTALGVLSIVFPGSGALLGALGSVGNAIFRHDGGPIGYFHGGGLPAASTDEQLVLAQHGEYMLSRQQVDNMGGPAGVERAASGGGGGGGTVIIQAIDSESLLRHYSGRGGRAFYNAALLGRGSISKLVRG